jgi:anthranilate synthase component 1
MATEVSDQFRARASKASVVPVVRRLMADHLTPVMAYRRLVAPDDRAAPSFLFESVENGTEVGRYSYLGAQPSLEVIARQGDIAVIDHAKGSRQEIKGGDPIGTVRDLSRNWTVAPPMATGDLPLPGFIGGWVGFAGYDTARFRELEAIPFSSAPVDDRHLPDLHMALYRSIVVFDHVTGVVHIVHNAIVSSGGDEEAWSEACEALDTLEAQLLSPSPDIPAGLVDIDIRDVPQQPTESNFTRDDFETAVERCRKYIAEGDIFQVVLSQRLERRTLVDPFEIYRALRVVNPSPYMIYLQAEGVILAASSPEILCRCRGREVINRPLAGTRKRSADPGEDLELEADLKTDAKEKAEHVMLVDLGRNDLGTVCELGSIEITRIMDVERYSHVMHLSSTVRGQLAHGSDSWDALAATLPVGTVSGAPKIRAMQIIDELEPTRRGPYAGGIGMVGLGGDMDVAIALRTMVIPVSEANADGWRIDLQAGAGIVIDSDPSREWEETIDKAAAMGRAIDVAEAAFGSHRD